jgi:cytidylate kinase
MALIAVSGHPGCRFEEVARITAQRLKFELLTQSRIQPLIGEEFGAESAIPDKAYPSLVTSILARLATENHIVYCALGGELQARHFPGMLRAHVVAPENARIGNLMIDGRLDRAAARQQLQELEAAERADRKAKFGKTKATADLFDLVLNAETLNSEQMAELIETAVAAAGLRERGYLSAAAEAQLQFQMRLKLARFGIAPPSKVSLRKNNFAHQSEEMFANLLDFYRIAWEYEPRSFPIQMDRDGNALEAFTPDFYLPEFDVYIELTTMKQAHVTRKNRKVRLLRQLYPQINIQVFYQKDFENLIFKYGLAERPVEA